MSPVSRAITLSPPADTIAINTMIAEAVTTVGSVFDTVLIAVEDDMQASILAEIPLPTTGHAAMTLNADGTYSYTLEDGGINEAFDIDVTYYSPANQQMSFATITTIPV